MNTAVRTAPYCMPVVGHVPALFRAPLKLFGRARECGDIARIRLGTSSIYLLNSADFIRQVLVTDADRFDRGRIFEKARSFIGNGLAATDGAFHLRQRRIMQPIFSRERTAGHVDVMRGQTEEMLATWRPNQAVDFERAINTLATTILTKSIFRSSIDTAIVGNVGESLGIVNRGVLVRALLPDWWHRLPVPSNRRFDRAREQLRAAVRDALRTYRCTGADQVDLLSALVNARYPDTGETMSDQQIVDEVITILLAGTETSSNTLGWLFHELGRDPEIEGRLHTELDTELAGRPISLVELPRLRYLHRLIDEVTRLYSPVWILMRRLTAPVDFGGVRLPAGAQVAYSSTALHRDPALYPDPFRFDPDRWLPERAAELPRSAFIPFGAGRHQCIGENFARVEIAVVAATIAARWRLRPPPGRGARERMASTLQPSAPPFTVEPRAARATIC